MRPKRHSAVIIPKTLVYRRKAESADSYLASAIAILRPVRWQVVIAATVAIAALTFGVKWTVKGSSWAYAAANAVMIAVGLGLAALSTRMMVADHYQKTRLNDISMESPETSQRIRTIPEGIKDDELG